MCSGSKCSRLPRHFRPIRPAGGVSRDVSNLSPWVGVGGEGSAAQILIDNKLHLCPDGLPSEERYSGRISFSVVRRSKLTHSAYIHSQIVTSRHVGELCQSEDSLGSSGSL